MTSHAIFTTIESELARAEGVLAELRQKVRALLPESSPGFNIDDGRAATAPVLPVDLTSSGAIHPRGFWFRGAFHQCHSYIAIYIGLLRAIAQHSPTAMSSTAAELRRYGRSRAYLAQRPEQLFRSRPAAWARDHSKLVVDGWYVDTNLSLSSIKKLIRRVLGANALRERVDVVFVWSRQPAYATKPQGMSSGDAQSAH